MDTKSFGKPDHKQEGKNSAKSTFQKNLEEFRRLRLEFRKNMDAVRQSAQQLRESLKNQK